MKLGGLFYQSGYGAFTSPPIFNDSNYCFLVFYHKSDSDMYGYTSLSVYIEESHGNKSTLLWSTDDKLAYWKQKVIQLPNTSSSYSIVFLGYFGSYGDLYLDDMSFIRCDTCKL